MNTELPSHLITRRQFAIGSAASLAALSFLPTRSLVASAQSADELAAMGFPELSVNLTDSSFEGLPESTPAGRYLLTATNSMTNPNPDQTGAVAFMSGAPLGMGASDLMQLIAGGGGAPSGTPAAGTSPEAGGGEEEGALPLEIYQLYFAGGVSTEPGETAMAVVDLKPGEYVVWGDDPEQPQQPTTLTVTGDFPQDVQDPAADITATLIDFAITIEGNLTPGTHVMKVQHHGAQPHFLAIQKGPDTMTKDLVMAAVMGEMSGTPTPGGFSDADLQPVFFSPTQSIGTTTWQVIDLTEGAFLAACFFPTAGTGAPHIVNGMLDVFTVGGASATPTS